MPSITHATSSLWMRCACSPVGGGNVHIIHPHRCLADEVPGRAADQKIDPSGLPVEEIQPAQIIWVGGPAFSNACCGINDSERGRLASRGFRCADQSTLCLRLQALADNRVTSTLAPSCCDRRAEDHLFQATSDREPAQAGLAEPTPALFGDVVTAERSAAGRVW